MLWREAALLAAASASVVAAVEAAASFPCVAGSCWEPQYAWRGRYSIYPMIPAYGMPAPHDCPK